MLYSCTHTATVGFKGFKHDTAWQQYNVNVYVKDFQDQDQDQDFPISVSTRLETKTQVSRTPSLTHTNWYNNNSVHSSRMRILRIVKNS